MINAIQKLEHNGGGSFDLSQIELFFNVLPGSTDISDAKNGIEIDL